MEQLLLAAEAISGESTFLFFFLSLAIGNYRDFFRCFRSCLCLSLALGEGPKAGKFQSSVMWSRYYMNPRHKREGIFEQVQSNCFRILADIISDGSR